MTVPFLLAAIAAALILRIPAFARWRMELLGGVSLAFVISLSDSPGDVVCLAAMAATGWVLMWAVSRHKNGLLLASGVGCVLAEFLVARQILPHPHIGRTIGLSYVMFRVIHLMVDAHGDELPNRLRLREYICYLFCYLTFLAGPIQRIQDFAETARRPIQTSWRDAAAVAIPDIVTGYLKFSVIAGAFYTGFVWSQNPPASIPEAVSHAIGWLAFAGYLFASFAGYTDVMRGIGKLIDLDLPPNFDRPFAAANFLDFWSRWHITLSEWFKLYVFNPLVKTLISRARPAMVPHLGAVGYFATFFLMGLWHGISLRFMLYGVCLGAGVSINKFFQYAMLRRLGRARLNALSRNPLYTEAARCLAVTFFVVVLGFLWIPSEAFTGATIGTWAAGAVVVLTAVALFGLLNRAMPAFGTMRSGGQIAMCATQVALILIYLLLLAGPVPVLLYEFF